MPLRFTCSCGKVLQVAEEFAGRSVRCPQCKNVLRAPNLAPAPVPVSPRAVPPATTAPLTSSAPAPAARREEWATESFSLPTPPASPGEGQPLARGEERFTSDSFSLPMPPPLPAEATLPLSPQEQQGFMEPQTLQFPPSLAANGPPPLPRRDPAEQIDSLGLVNHAGEPVAADDDFFVLAPTEIGRVISAHTTLKTHKEPWSWPARMAFLLPVFLGCLAILVILVIHKPSMSWLVLLILAGWTVLVLALTRFSHTVNYVGTQGLAVFKCGGHRRRITRTDIFLFQDAVDLRTGQTNVFVNGIYTGTNYSFTWTDEEGGKVFLLSGQHRARNDLPPAKHPFRFALGAEAAWTGFLAENMDTLLVDRHGFLFFPLYKNDWIRLGSNLIRLFQGGQEVELGAEHIQKIIMGQGVISIHEMGSKEGWFSSTGVYRFEVKNLANARFFLFALDRLVGFKLY